MDRRGNLLHRLEVEGVIIPSLSLLNRRLVNTSSLTAIFTNRVTDGRSSSRHLPSTFRHRSTKIFVEGTETLTVRKVRPREKVKNHMKETNRRYSGEESTTVFEGEESGTGPDDMGVVGDRGLVEDGKREKS